MKKEAKTKLTTTQLLVLQIIKENSRMVSPTYDEIAALMDFSKSAARNICNLLVKRGMLSRGPGIYRNLLVTDEGKKASRKGTK